MASPARKQSCADLYCLFLRQPIATCDFPAFQGERGPTQSGSAHAYLCSEKHGRFSYQVRTNPNTSKTIITNYLIILVDFNKISH